MQKTVNTTLYGMITVRSSTEYTKVALDTFFKHTALKPGDKVILIDNDGEWCRQVGDNSYPLYVVSNDYPKNTAENINQLVQIALQDCCNFVFLNNDVVFTPKWFERIVIDDYTVSIPACNQVVDCGFPSSTNLLEFKNQYSKLNAVSHLINANFSNPFERLIMPMYVCRIPLPILQDVGYFDEEFYVGGEDVDYRLRLLKKGYNIKYSSAFLLHFNGKSSWDGPEKTEETVARNQRYFDVFSKKWGSQLANLCLINGNPDKIISDFNLSKFLPESRYNEMIMSLLSLD